MPEPRPAHERAPAPAMERCLAHAKVELEDALVLARQASLNPAPIQAAINFLSEVRLEMTGQVHSPAAPRK